MLDMFQVSAPTKAEREQGSDRDDPIKVFRAATGALLEIDSLASKAVANRARAQKIIDRLDNPEIVAPPEQRGEAESAVYELRFTANQIVNEEIPRHARRFMKLWPNLSAADRDWIQRSFVAGWSTSPAWSVLDADPLLSKDKVIRDLILRANRVDEVKVPF